MGFGRTGKMFAHQYEKNIEQKCLSKGLTVIEGDAELQLMRFIQLFILTKWLMPFFILTVTQVTP